MANSQTAALIISTILSTLSLCAVTATATGALHIAPACGLLSATGISWCWCIAIYVLESIVKSIKKELRADSAKINTEITSNPHVDIPDQRAKEGTVYLHLLRGENHPDGP